MMNNIELGRLAYITVESITRKGLFPKYNRHKGYVAFNQLLAEYKSRIAQLEALLGIERLASLIHDEWISWSKTLAEKKEVTPEKAKAWEKYWVPYSELSEEVKDMDREWAYKVALKEPMMNNKEKTTVGSMCPGSTIPINFLLEQALEKPNSG